MRVRGSMRADAKLFRILVCIALLTATVSSVFRAQDALAATQITSRSLTLMAGDDPVINPDGGSMVGGVVRHKFDFVIPTAGNIGSIKFEYCTTATTDVSCTTPTGLVTTTAELDGEAGNGPSGFTLNNTLNGAPYLTRASNPVSSGVNAIYTFKKIKNPTTTVASQMTFFVRISTYVSTNATGTAVDSGTVAASTSTQIVLKGIMPESLIFCAGTSMTVNATTNVPDCSSISTGNVVFNQLFSPTDTATATSQMAASTNAGSGYSITVNGLSMASGSNVIPAMTGQVDSARGTGQFGLNLKANDAAVSTVPVGAEVSLPYNVGNKLLGQPAAGYDTMNKFKFVSGNSVAASTGATNSQLFSVSYIVNVPGSQSAGEYTTTLTYICTPKF